MHQCNVCKSYPHYQPLCIDQTGTINLRPIVGRCNLANLSAWSQSIARLLRQLGLHYDSWMYITRNVSNKQTLLQTKLTVTSLQAQTTKDNTSLGQCKNWGVGTWCTLPTGDEVWGGGCAPSSENFWISDIKIVSLCILDGVIYRLAACFARKKWCLWSSKTKTYCCLRVRRDRGRQRQTEREREREERQSRNKNLSKVQIILH